MVWDLRDVYLAFWLVIHYGIDFVKNRRDDGLSRLAP